jgi:flagellar motility protein MotE (MotC chaperone)
MTWLNRLKVMPLLIIVASLSFGVRFGEFVTGVSSSPGTAQAQPDPALLEPVQAEEEEAADAEEATSDTEADIEPISSDDVADGGKPEITLPGDEEEWKDSIDSDIEYSEVRMELFEDLSKRRKNLEARERELAVREALLKAAEQEIDQKYQELVSLRSEIQDLLVEQSEEEKERIASLVKIYEGMKPKDAARIFNTLDLDVLLQVVAKMSERKSAPIIASMNPERARTLTIMLMEQKSLPDLSEDLMQ